MDPIDQFTATAPDESAICIKIMQVLDDDTWFEVYAADQLIGKLHWRSDIDAYMVLRLDSMCGNFPVLIEAEDFVVRQAGYDIPVPTVEADVNAE